MERGSFIRIQPRFNKTEDEKMMFLHESKEEKKGYSSATSPASLWEWEWRSSITLHGPLPNGDEVQVYAAAAASPSECRNHELLVPPLPRAV